MFNLEELAEWVWRIDRPTEEIRRQTDVVKSLTKQALEAGVSAKDILEKALIPAMELVGEKFKNNEYYVPEVLVAARAMKAAMEILRPILADADVPLRGKVAIGTVHGDLHDIGKNLVAMMLEGAGFQITDLGVDVPPEKFVETVQQEGSQIVALSALLTTTMPAMKTTIDALSNSGLREKVKVMIGGAPVTQSYADEIGADGYAPDAARAVEKAKELLGIT